jgi:hypothetical protein
VTLAVTGINIFAVGLFGVRGCPYSSGIEYRYYRKSMGHTVGERSWKDADFRCISCIKQWRLWKCVVTVMVKGKPISDRIVRRQRVPVFQLRRLLLTGSRWDTRWVSGRGTPPTFSLIPVFSVAVTGKVL